MIAVLTNQVGALTKEVIQPRQQLWKEKKKGVFHLTGKVTTTAPPKTTPPKTNAEIVSENRRRRTPTESSGSTHVWNTKQHAKQHCAISTHAPHEVTRHPSDRGGGFELGPEEKARTAGAAGSEQSETGKCVGQQEPHKVLTRVLGPRSDGGRAPPHAWRGHKGGGGGAHNVTPAKNWPLHIARPSLAIFALLRS